MRAADIKVLGGGPVTIRLLVDCESTDGAISANRTLLRQGASGPPPHYHAGSAEIFFILAGSLQALARDRVVALSEGDFLVIPRQMPHASAAPPQADGGHPMTDRPKAGQASRPADQPHRHDAASTGRAARCRPPADRARKKQPHAARYARGDIHVRGGALPHAGLPAGRLGRERGRCGSGPSWRRPRDAAGDAGRGSCGGAQGHPGPPRPNRVRQRRNVESCLIESADPESFAASAATIAVFRVGDLA